MNPAHASSTSDTTVGFADGFGERALVTDRSSGETLEILRLRSELTAAPSFEFALRERTARLANFRHTAYGRVRRIDRRAEAGGGLVVVSEHVDGVRLADILRVTERDGLALNINAALCLIRQLVPAIALLHENARDVAHGAIAPERLIVTRHARLVVVEHVLGAAVEQLHYGRDRFWRELRVAMPPAAGMLRCDQRTDVTQVGVVALSLILGRALHADEFPSQIPRLLEEATELSVLGDRQPISEALRQWVQRMLQLDLRWSFATTREASHALEQLLSDEQGYVAAPVALETFLVAYEAGERGLPVGMATSSRADEPAIDERHESAADPDVQPAPTRNAIPIASPLVSRPPAVSPPRAEPRAEEAPPDGAGIAASPIELFRAPSPKAVAAEPSSPPSAGTVSAPLIESMRASAPGEPIRRSVPAVDLLRAIEPAALARASGARAHGQQWRRAAIVILALVAFGEGIITARRVYWQGVPAPARPGTLVVQSSPPGVEVYIDGLARGRTPAQVSLVAGAHILELRGRGIPRVIPLTIEAGAKLSQYLELTEAPASGSLEIRSDPPGARVLVDGVAYGVTPLALADVAPGEHAIVLDGGHGPVHQAVTVQAGATASIVVPIIAPPSGPVSGWLAVSAPFEMNIFEDGRLLGTTASERIMVSAGRHVFEIVNETLGYRGTHPVTVVAGKVVGLQIDLPKGTMHLNATPWAEVWVDGQRLGDTPLGNLAVAIGAHEVVFRHPQLGEKRMAVTVTLATPARVSVDMSSR